MSTNMEADQDDISSMSGSSDVELSPPSIHSSSTSVATSKRKPGRKNHPVYRGVRERSRGKWVCEVREPIKQKRIWLGTHPTPEMAARAYDAATLSLRGDTDTLLNFPDSAWRLPRAISSSPAHIQVAAMEAAELFRPPCPVAQELVPASPSSQMPPSGLASEDGIIVDEEEVFNMPTLLADMAQGLLLPPPYLHKGFDNDDMDKYVDISLWNF